MWESLREKMGVCEKRKRPRFKGHDVVVWIEGRSDMSNDYVESMWFDKSDKQKAIEEAVEEVLIAGGMAKWKSLEWIDTEYEAIPRTPHVVT